MPVDERDYMIDRVRERDRYVEKSPLRANLKALEEEKRRQAALRGWLNWLAYVAAIVLVAIAIKFILRR